MSKWTGDDAERMQRRVHTLATGAVAAIKPEFPRSYKIQGPPLGVNHMKVPVQIEGGQRLVLTSEAKAWLKQAEAQLRRQHGILLPFDQELFIFIDVYRPRNAGDWDNPVKAATDSLQNAGVITNDSIIRRGTVTKFTDKENPRTEIIITESTLKPLK